MTTAANLPSNPPAGDALVSLAERASRVDHAVAQAALDTVLCSAPAGVAILAVGGYGRRQLFPFSDVDLLLLCQTDALATANKEAISAFLQRLWDGGMRISQSVRTAAECLEVHEGNTELNISLLDQRFLAGDRALYAEMSRKFPRFVQSQRDALMRNLTRLTRERHARYADTFYHLEPNVKETPGGLRDLQLYHWMEQLRETDATRLASPQPPADLQHGFRFLARVRWSLHEEARRDNNLLHFEAQDTLGGHDVARWMREYYRHARTIHRAAVRVLEASEAQSSGLFSQFCDWRSRLSNAEFGVHRERVHFRTPQQLDTEPELVLRLFEFVARHGVRPAWEAGQQQIGPRLETLREHFGEPRPVWPVLARILSLPHAPLAVRAMHETGVLFAVFPELEAIECLVVRDFYHRYTVDEHTLVAMQNLWSATAHFGGLLGEVDQAALLLFALLFHDAGKGTQESHVDASLRLADSAMQRIQVPEAERQTARFLIANHLELSKAMQTRDLGDPDAVREVAHQVETVERLRALTLVTYADISAVNPGAMTPWRAQQLWQLYIRVHQELTRELERERIEGLAGPPERNDLLDGLPMRYLRTHTDAEVAAHLALEQKSRARGAAAEVRRLESVWQLTVIARDRMGLFAAAAGTLAGFGMNILRAEAFANRRGLVLDTFVFADLNRTLELNPSEVDRLRSVVEKVLLGKTDVRELLRNRPKPRLPSRKAQVPVSIHFDPDASPTATLVEIVAQDRPGLLYDLASAISAEGGNIEVVLIDTQAHRAVDVFYLTSEGKKLTAGKQSRMAEALCTACEAG